MNKRIGVSFSLVGVALLLGAGTASAERIPAWSGSPSPLSDVHCWNDDGGVLRLDSDCWDNAKHWFNVAVPVASATAGQLTRVDVSWIQGFDNVPPGTTLGGPGEVCGKLMWTTGAGEFSTQAEYQCGAGTKSSFLNLPTGSNMTTVALTIRMVSQGTTIKNSWSWVSTVNYSSGARFPSDP